MGPALTKAHSNLMREKISTLKLVSFPKISRFLFCAKLRKIFSEENRLFAKIKAKIFYNVVQYYLKLLSKFFLSIKKLRPNL